MAFLPDERILVTEKLTKAKGTISGVPTVRYQGQGGFGDVAIYPRFHENNMIYISYAEARDGSTNTTTLWISSGERQQMDPAQSMASNLGKIVRLNDDGSLPSASSALGANPFASQGGVAAQVWALGVRNPLGIDFDEAGRLWEIEMGLHGGDELNLIEKGANYGWPLVSEGVHYGGGFIPEHNTRPEMKPPKAFWVPVISPSSVIIYKGDLFKGWKGNALISALGAQGVVRVEISSTQTAREVQRIGLGRRTRCIRQSADGALWTLEDGAGGRLLKHTPRA
ncbi:putative sugar dehydrogenase [Rhypophila decipiens]